jgi:hypothetical protein
MVSVCKKFFKVILKIVDKSCINASPSSIRDREQTKEIKMKTLSKRLNFSLKKDHASAIRVDKWTDVAYYETLCKYCADNDINVAVYSDRDFNGAVEALKTYGQHDKSVDHYYFWIN